jgi:hypothetical protein
MRIQRVIIAAGDLLKNALAQKFTTITTARIIQRKQGIIPQHAMIQELCVIKQQIMIIV